MADTLSRARLFHKKSFRRSNILSGFKRITLNNFRISRVTQKKHAGANRYGSSAAKTFYSGDYWLANCQSRCGSIPRPYHTFKDEFSVADGIVHKGQEAVILGSMRLAIENPYILDYAPVFEKPRFPFYRQPWFKISSVLSLIVRP